jgi:hypothetical protein
MGWPGSWPSHVLSGSRSKLTELRDEVDGLDTGASTETEQAMTRFLVIRSCGHLEFTFDESFCAFAESKSSPEVGAYVRGQFFRGANPSPERISQTLRRLDGARADRFENKIEEDDQRLRRELAFLVDRRNKIAHGQSETVRRRKALDLAEVALELSDWIVTELDPRA